jgi:dolichol-phosphate mannosyltransferase
MLEWRLSPPTFRRLCGAAGGKRFKRGSPAERELKTIQRFEAAGLRNSTGTLNRPPVQKDCSQKLAIVIPTLCEAGNIRELLERIQCSFDPLGVTYESIVVDDDSGDGIESLVKELSDKDPRIRLLIRKNARGLAGAIIHGWHNTDAGVLCAMDADLQHPPELLPQLWHALQSGADCVVASRYAPQSSRPNWSRLRPIVSKLAIWMARPLQKPGIRVWDPMSGFFLVRRSCIETVQFQSEGFKILLEILARGKIRSVLEVPCTLRKRRAGKSKASSRVAFDYLRLLARLWKERVLTRTCPGKPPFFEAF